MYVLTRKLLFAGRKEKAAVEADQLLKVVTCTYQSVIRCLNIDYSMQKIFVVFILESSLSQDADIAMLPVDDDDDNPEKDPFIPHERVFAKYAAMLYSSDNGGKTFHEFKESKFCASCGEKVRFSSHCCV